MVVFLGILLAIVSQKWVYGILVAVLFVYGLIRLVIVNHGYLLLTIIYPESGRNKLKMTIIIKNMAYYIGATIISVGLQFVNIQFSFGSWPVSFFCLAFFLGFYTDSLRQKNGQKN
jgi:hypothetical protein